MKNVICVASSADGLFGWGSMAWSLGAGVGLPIGMCFGVGPENSKYAYLGIGYIEAHIGST